MIFEFKLPDIGEGLSEGELLAWHVQPGDTVEEGQDVAEFNTDKVAVVLPSPRSGRVIELLASPGDIVPVGKVILRIEVEASSPMVSATGAGGNVPAAAGRAAAEAPSAAGEGGPAGGDVAAARIAGAPGVRAVPVARRYAQERGVDLAMVAARVGDRMITRADIDEFLALSGSAGRTVDQGTRRERLSGARLGAAQRLAKSVHTLATSTLTIDVNGDAILAKCQGESPRVSPLAVIAHCACAALREHPRLNARIDEDAGELVMYGDIHLGIAVDAGDGLLVAVIEGAGDLDIKGMAERIVFLTDQTRKGAPAPLQGAGSTFTISSTGGLEQAAFVGATPIVNLPNVATLWTSRIRERPRVIKGVLGAGPVFSCSLSFDHRYIHGAEAIRFLNGLSAGFERGD